MTFYFVCMYFNILVNLVKITFMVSVSYMRVAWSRFVTIWLFFIHLLRGTAMHIGPWDSAVYTSTYLHQTTAACRFLSLRAAVFLSIASD